MLKIQLPVGKSRADIPSFSDAIYSKNMAMFDLVLKHRNPNKHNGRSPHPIFMSIEVGNLEMFTKLINHPKFSLTLRNYSKCKNTILTAVFYSSMEPTEINQFVDVILKKDTNHMLINLKNEIGETPLYLACIRNEQGEYTNNDDYKSLLAKISVVPGIKPLSLAAIHAENSSWLNRVDSWKILMELDIPFDPNRLYSGVSTIYYLIMKGNMECIKQFLVFKSLNLNLCNTTECKYPMAALHSAIHHLNDDGIINMLINDHRTDINLRDRTGKTPLQYAILKKKISVIKQLLQVGDVFPELGHKQLNLSYFENYLGLIKQVRNFCGLDGHQDQNQSTFITRTNFLNFFQNSDLSEIIESLNMGFKPPVHARPFDVLDLLGESEFYITEKADGVYRNSMPANVYPSFPTEPDILVEAEYIQSLDLFLVFNVTSPGIVGMNYNQRMNWLRERHGYVSHYLQFGDVALYDDISYEKDLKALDKFIKDNNGKPKWYPKYVGHRPRGQLSEYFFRQYGLYVDETAKQPFAQATGGCKNTVFPTDGIIVVYGDRTIKLKPKSQLTVDLLFRDGCLVSREGSQISKILFDYGNDYNNGLIYRCYWKEDKGRVGWCPREVRHDKRLANPDSIIDELTAYHMKPWTLNNILELKNITPYYKTVSKDRYINTSFTKNQNNVHKRSLELALLAISKNNNKVTGKWLDLGFGKRKQYIEEIFLTGEYQWVGIELDSKLVSNARTKYPDGHWIFGDFSKPWDIKSNSTEYDNNFIREMMCVDRGALEGTFNGILSYNTIHYATKSLRSWTTFIQEINNHTAIGSYWIISMLDADALSQLAGSKCSINLDNRNWVSIQGKPNSLENGLPMVKFNIWFKYEWLSEVMEEPCISYKNLLKELSPQWKLANDFTQDSLKPSFRDRYMHSSWRDYQKCFKYFMLVRTN